MKLTGNLCVICGHDLAMHCCHAHADGSSCCSGCMGASLTAGNTKGRCPAPAEAEALLDTDGLRERLQQAIDDLHSGRTVPIDHLTARDRIEKKAALAMTTASDITDITWTMMGDAGINIGLVNVRATELGEREYVLTDGDTKIAFGPAVDVEGDGSTHGWDVSTYELRKDSEDDDGYWEHIHQEWAETPAEALQLVAAEVAS